MRRAISSPTRTVTALLLVLVLPWSSSAQEPAASDDAALELFEREVRPLFVETCVKCHGATKQESALRLDSRAAAIQGGDSGAAIVPGAPEKSLLVQAIRHLGDIKMPPKSKLGEPQIAAVERWIKLGAPWPATDGATADKWLHAKSHWAFQPVRDPPAPRVARESQPANPLDAFVAAKHDAAGLTPSPPADRRTLIRRATFDLHGLPPSPEDVAAFEKDDDPQAFEKLVERLLASPRYGEQWGRHWLDVARYSDTKGYVYAREQRFWVHAWVYRDWVVQALNDDMPYDRFLLLQMAADQVAPDDKANLAALGYLTLGRRFLGVTHDIIDDRIDVVTRGTMGLTVACARCHDHKYDPIPTRDYYSLYGVFANCRERQVRIGAGSTDPAAAKAFEDELTKRQEKLSKLLAQRRSEAAARVRARVGDYLFAQREITKYPAEGFDVVLATDDIIPASLRRWQRYLALAKKSKDPIFAPWFAYYDLTPEQLAAEGAALTAKLAAAPATEVHPLVAEKFATPPQTHAEVAQRYGELFASVEAQWQEALQAARDKKEPPPEKLAHPALESLRAVLYGPTAPCEIPDEAMVNIEYYFDLASCEELWRVQAEVDNWLIQSPAAPSYVQILEDREHTWPAYVFKRGRPTTPGEEAPRQFLELLEGTERKPFERGSGRLELAQKIIDPSNPLTARVMVNRVWLHHFGAGLVTSPSDFGTRAPPPTHPELLDWLAARFREDGWSIKKLHRRIMLSDAYRRDSLGPRDARALAKAREVDPENRLLWRMNTRRLTFEELRDGLFAATGELDLRSGGKPEDLFAGGFRRRTLYGRIDRQFLPSTLRIFDFANPDLHIPQRSDTTVPQQALFFLNNELALGRARALAARVPAELLPEAKVQWMFQRAYQRPATPDQVAAALELVNAKDETPQPPATAKQWSYGFAGYDEKTKQSTNFTPLPHFSGAAWQGGSAWPDAKLGWVQLTASGGHAGNDAAHAAVRRWTAPRDMKLKLDSTLKHAIALGDGVRGRLISSRGGLLHTAQVHNGQADFHLDEVEVKTGETLDFAVDIGGTLNNDQFTWEVILTPLAEDGDKRQTVWNSRTDFVGPIVSGLSGWEQLAQVLLAANEFMFVD